MNKRENIENKIRKAKKTRKPRVRKKIRVIGVINMQ